MPREARDVQVKACESDRCPFRGYWRAFCLRCGWSAHYATGYHARAVREASDHAVQHQKADRDRRRRHERRHR